MNLPRVALAALAGTVAYFLLGGLLFTNPLMKQEFQRYPAVYRSLDDMKAVFPLGIAGMLLSIVAATMLYALAYQGGSRLAEGARFGGLIGAFAVGGFVLHNYVNLNIGLRLTIQQAVAYFAEWVIVGIVIGLIYRPATP